MYYTLLQILPVIVDDGYAFPIILEKEALVLSGAPHGSSESPPSSCNLISASPSSCFKWDPNFSGFKTEIKISLVES